MSHDEWRDCLDFCSVFLKLYFAWVWLIFNQSTGKKNSLALGPRSVLNFKGQASRVSKEILLWKMDFREEHGFSETCCAQKKGNEGKASLFPSFSI